MTCLDSKPKTIKGLIEIYGYGEIKCVKQLTIWKRIKD